MKLLNASIVVKGNGFTPQVVGAKAFADIFSDPPVQVMTTTAITVLTYQDNFQVVVSDEGVEARRSLPPNGEDRTLQRIVARVPQLWPLVEPSAVGINFLLHQGEGDELPSEELANRLVNKGLAEEIFGSSLVGTTSSFSFIMDGARVTVAAHTGRSVPANMPAGAIWTFNAHYEPVEDFGQVLATQGRWYDRLIAWIGRFVNGH